MPRVLGSCIHTPHSPHLFATGGSDGSVLLCSVKRCSTGRSSQNKQQEDSGPLAHSCDLFHLPLSLRHVDPNSMSGREVSAFYRAPPHSTALYTSCKGIRNAVSHSLKWPLASWSLPVLTTDCMTVWCVPAYIAAVCTYLQLLCTVTAVYWGSALIMNFSNFSQLCMFICPKSLTCDFYKAHVCQDTNV